MRKYKYIWLPCLLGAYFAFMTSYFGIDLLKSGESTRFWLTVGSELIVLIALVFFLKKRERLRIEREKDLTNNKKERNGADNHDL